MNWYPSYRCEFQDILGLQWKVDIEEWLSSQGAITNMIATGDPLNIEFLSDSQELFDSPIKGSRANLTIYSETDFQWIAMYSSGNFEKRMCIYHGATLYWKGFVLADSYSEPYDGVAYPVTISAADGLGVLKNLKYDDEGVYYNGRKTISAILIDVLAKIQFNEFIEYVNIYEERMNQTATDSIFNQTSIDVDIFKNMYCYEVLQEILKTFNALIRQVNGIMTIYRPTELSQASINGRHFISATTKSAASALVPEQFIHRAAIPSDRLSINGGNLAIVHAAKNIKLNQDYGYKKSWLDNGEFRGSTFDIYDTDGLFENWNNTASAIRLITNELYLSGEPDGAVIAANATQKHTYLSQIFGTNSVVSATDVFVFEFKYLHSNYYGNDIKYVRIEIVLKSNAGTPHYLRVVDGEFCEWTTTPTSFDIGGETVHAGNTGWKSIQRKVVGLPDAGQYTCTIYNSYNLHDSDHIAAITTGFKDVCFYATSDEINYKKYPGFHFPFVIFPKKGHATIYIDNKEMVGKELILTNSFDGEDIEYDYKLGDVDDTNIKNIIEQFQGSLTIAAGFTEVWNTISPGSEDTCLLEIIGGEIQTQYSKPHQLLKIPIRETKNNDNLPHINICGSFKDSLNLYSGNDRIFVFEGGDFKVKQRTWDLDLIEKI
jgi:hypothetical protein